MFGGDLRPKGKDFSVFAIEMVGVRIAKEPAGTLPGLKEHAISSRTWRTIGDAMLHDMWIDAGAQFSCDYFPTSTIEDFRNCEVFALREFAVEQSRGNPDFIRYPDRGTGAPPNFMHGSVPKYISTLYLVRCQPIGATA